MLTWILRALIVLLLLGSGLSPSRAQETQATGESPAETRPPTGSDRGPADDFERRLRNYRVELDPAGAFSGTVRLLEGGQDEAAPVRELTVWFVQNGSVKAEVRPDDSGVFTVQGLTPGIYSLVGAGPGGYIAYGLEIVPHRPAGRAAREGDAATLNGAELHRATVPAALLQEVTRTLSIDSLAVPPRDLTVVRQLLRSYVPADVLSANPGELPEIAKPQEIPVDDAEQLPDDADTPSTVLQSHAVRIGTDGTIVGRTRRLHPGTGRPTRLRRLNVFLVRENSIVAQAPVTEAGRFEFRSVSPGRYSFVAAGLEGFAAFSVQAVVPDSVAWDTISDELIVPVALLADEDLDLDASLVPPEDSGFAANTLNNIVNNQVATNGLRIPGSDDSEPQGVAGSGTGTGASSGGSSGGDSGSGGGAPPGGGGGLGSGGTVLSNDQGDELEGVPEIDPASAGSAVALLIGAAFLVTDLRRRREARDC